MASTQGRSLLATYLFTDIVASTELAGSVGDRRWQAILGRHHAIVRRELRRWGGREIDTAGDGFFASFETPARAIRCAHAIAEAMPAIGIQIRAGIHMGEAEASGKKVSGISVHIAARAMGAAGPGEVVVTGVVRDLVPGSGFTFEDLGPRTLKGIPGQHHLYRVTSVDERPASGLVEEEELERRRRAIEPRRGRSVDRRPVVVGASIVAVVALLAVLIRHPWTTSGTATPSGSISHSSASRASSAAPAGPLVEFVAQVDAMTGHVVAEIPLGKDPAAIAFGHGSAWVVNRGDRSISRIDPASHRVSATIPDVGTDPASIAVGPESVWVGDRRGRRAIRIDPASNQIVDTIDLPGRVQNIAVDEAAVWAALDGVCLPCDEPYAIVRISPTTGRVEATVPLGFGAAAPGTAMGLAIGEGETMATIEHGSMAFMDRSDGTLIELLDLHHSIADVAWMDGVAWVALFGTPGSVVGVDVAARQTGTPIPGGGGTWEFGIGTPMHIAAGSEGIWVTDGANGTASHVLPDSGITDAPIALGTTPTGIAVGLGFVWVCIDGDYRSG
jgi:YVTN family beta-propeller protein